MISNCSSYLWFWYPLEPAPKNRCPLPVFASLANQVATFNLANENTWVLIRPMRIKQSFTRTVPRLNLTNKQLRNTVNKTLLALSFSYLRTQLSNFIIRTAHHLFLCYCREIFWFSTRRVATRSKCWRFNPHTENSDPSGCLIRSSSLSWLVWLFIRAATMVVIVF